MIDLTEDQLFELAHPRGNLSLWEALSHHAGAGNAFGQAHKILADLLDRTDYLTPFALFSHVTVACDGRRKALGRLGFEADDPMDEFLALALAYEKNHPPSLQAFLHWVQRGEIEIKRDLEQGGGDAVRIMTVHGSGPNMSPWHRNVMSLTLNAVDNKATGTVRGPSICHDYTPVQPLPSKALTAAARA